MASMRRVPLAVPGLGEVQTAYAGPAAPTPGAPAFVLLHGFDSSSLEFRRFVPLLSQLGDVYAGAPCCCCALLLLRCAVLCRAVPSTHRVVAG